MKNFLHFLKKPESKVKFFSRCFLFFIITTLFLFYLTGNYSYFSYRDNWGYINRQLVTIDPSSEEFTQYEIKQVFSNFYDFQFYLYPYPGPKKYIIKKYFNKSGETNYIIEIKTLFNLSIMRSGMGANFRGAKGELLK